MHRLASTAMATKNTPIVVILGATGAGKSQLALELAAKFGGEIISADAMQMYKGLDIVTNKVTEEEQRMVKHHMINILDPLSINNVVDFRNRALPIVEKLMMEGKIPVICGGTNYYIESLLWKVLVDEATPFILSGKRKLEGEEGNVKESKCSRTEVLVKSAEDNCDIKDTSTNTDTTEDSEFTAPLTISSVNWDSDPGHPHTAQLYTLLLSVDPDRAAVLHPRERRKIWRSLQVFSQHGVTHSKLLKEQGGTPGMGGGLRFTFDNICIIEVWSDQEVLDIRCNKRVEKMLARGLVEELEQFHKEYNTLRAEKGGMESLEYQTGIWQSIGFKEFHKYLCLDKVERQSEEGKKLFVEGVERMKITTRQYSRKQTKWIKKRFLLDTRSPPPVFRVDSTDPSLWQEKVFQPAEIIVRDFIEGRTPDMEPLERSAGGEEREEDCRRIMHCDVCNRDFKGAGQFSMHQRGSSHKKMVQKAKVDNDKEEVHIVVNLVSYNEERRNEVAKIIKNTFNIGLSEVFCKMDSMPAVLSNIRTMHKAKSIAKELSKHGIVLDVKREVVQLENTAKAQTG